MPSTFLPTRAPRLARFRSVLVALLACGAWTAPGAAAAPASPSAIDSEMLRIARGVELWPGFEPESTPLAVGSDDATTLFRHPSPPEGYSPVEGEEGSWRREGLDPAVKANSFTEIGGVVSATLLLRPSDDSDSTELAAVAIHEAFHVFQRARHPGWSANEADRFLYPVDSAPVLEARRRESEALRRALGATDRATSACWALEALAAREARFDLLDPILVSYESATELNEGLAAYVQARALGRSTVELPDGGFAAEAVRSRAYATGPAVAFLLDRFRPGWRSALETDDTIGLDALLRDALDPNETSGSSCGFSEEEVREIARRAAGDVGEVTAEREAAARRFEALPGWRVEIEAPARVPVELRGFDPLNVRQVSAGVLHDRYLELAGGALESFRFLVDGSGEIQARTVAAGPHPLFSGIGRVVVAGLEEPAVTEIEDGSLELVVNGLALRFRGTWSEGPGRRIAVRLDPTSRD